MFHLCYKRDSVPLRRFFKESGQKNFNIDTNVFLELHTKNGEMLS